MNDHQINLDTSKTGNGVPLIYTHGWADDRTAWDGVIDSIGDDVSHIPWSIRGHGESDAPPPGNYTRTHTLNDLERVVEMADDQVVLVGHSLGGYLSLAFCLQHPNRVKALVLIGAGPGFRKEETRNQWNASVKSSAKTMDIPEGSEEAALHVDSWVIDSLGEITVPVLVIVGERDKRFETGHSVHRKNPQAVAQAIESFLSEIN